MNSKLESDKKSNKITEEYEKIKIIFMYRDLFGAMSFGVFFAYNHLTMSDAERAILENVKALTSGEFPGGGKPLYSCQVGKLRLKQSNTEGYLQNCNCMITNYLQAIVIPKLPRFRSKTQFSGQQGKPD